MSKIFAVVLASLMLSNFAFAEDKPDALKAEVEKAKDDKDYKKAIEAIDKLVKIDADSELEMTQLKYRLLLEKGDVPEAMTVAKKLKTLLKDNADALNELAWNMVDPEHPIAKADLDVAQSIAEDAVKLSESKTGAILDTLARVHFAKGKVDKAIELQTKALEVANEGEEKDTLQKSMDEYKAKKAAAPAKPDEKK